MKIEVERDIRFHEGGTKYYATYLLKVEDVGYLTIFNWGRVAPVDLWPGVHGQSSINAHPSIVGARVAIREKIKAKVKNGYSSAEKISSELFEINDSLEPCISSRKLFTPILFSEFKKRIGFKNPKVEESKDIECSEVTTFVSTPAFASSSHENWGSW